MPPMTSALEAISPKISDWPKDGIVPIIPRAHKARLRPAKPSSSPK